MRNPALRVTLALALVAAACERPPNPTQVEAPVAAQGRQQAPIRVNVLLDGPATPTVLGELAAFGPVVERIDEIHALTLRAREGDVGRIAALPNVVAAAPDALREGSPVDGVALGDFAGGLSTWDLDAVDVTGGPGFGTRAVPYDGAGVYVGVLDTGLLDSWRQYFPQERIAVEYARAFSGGPLGAQPETPNVWEHDQDSHGTHVTSSILGYSLGGTPINGVAPMATVIPVKVLGQNGSGFSSVIARGIVYVADLKAGPLAGSPVIINMSLGGTRLDPVEKAALDYALARGVIVVGSAGNRGPTGQMSYPGAYPPVISVAATGWTGEWVGGGSWWWSGNVAEDDASVHYVAPFSSRPLPGQDLDVAAPGSWVVGPYQTQSGKTSHFFLGGTSMAAPHVAGIVALMAQKDPGLTAAQAESILEATALPLGAGCRDVTGPTGVVEEVCWSADRSGHGLARADAALGL